MEKELSFKKGEKLVTITFNSKGYFGLSATIYNLSVYSKEELTDTVREGIEGDLDYYVNDLQDNSINELVDDRVADIMSCTFDYNDSIYSDTKDDDLIQVEWEYGGQAYDELLKMFPNSESIKELFNIWRKYQLNKGVDSTIVDRTNELLNQLDSGNDAYDLAETIVKDYIKKNY